MLRSLVGSEMCIRDRNGGVDEREGRAAQPHLPLIEGLLMTALLLRQLVEECIDGGTRMHAKIVIGNINTHASSALRNVLEPIWKALHGNDADDNIPPIGGSNDNTWLVTTLGELTRQLDDEGSLASRRYGYLTKSILALHNNNGTDTTTTTTTAAVAVVAPTASWSGDNEAKVSGEKRDSQYVAEEDGVIFPTMTIQTTSSSSEGVKRLWDSSTVSEFKSWLVASPAVSHHFVHRTSSRVGSVTINTKRDRSPTMVASPAAVDGGVGAAISETPSRTSNAPQQNRGGRRVEPPRGGNKNNTGDQRNNKNDLSRRHNNNNNNNQGNTQSGQNNNRRRWR
eukprot:TRINITY_DN16544_c0_g1_i2.p1 TRINITY_DN16544_c0_g1~~TRINITY_DN16544_c0_g1_i2.p1  ORF type:complete len:339 (+),score=68.52 TRINITY_DN16544_c0_g1_i2:88-1104(+)